MNLLEPPHSAQFSTFCRSTWTGRLDGEHAAPERRIIHSRGLRLPTPARLDRLGLRTGRGYFKCGSDPFPWDWASDARVMVGDGAAWRTILELRDLPRPAGEGEVAWFDLGGREAAAAIVQLRRSSVDGWWPSWNLAMSGVVLEGGWEGGAPSTPAPGGSLEIGECSLEGLPAGVEARQVGGGVRYRSRFFQAGFLLRRAGFSFLAVDDEGKGRVERNLLANGGFELFEHPLREHLVQGVRLCPSAGPQAVSYFAHGVTGSARVRGGVVEYEVRIEPAGQVYRLRWEVREEGLSLKAEREGARPLRAWESSAWHIAFDSRASAVSLIGEITREGEAGIMRPPLLVHAPGHGTFHAATRGPALWRADSARPIFVCSAELKLGEEPQPEGDSLLLPGRHAVELELLVRAPILARARAGTPAPVERALRRCALTALPYRPDTATLSNNGNSMHAPLCMDNWSALAVRMGEVLPGLPATALLRASLERWMDGGQGYASGPSARTGGSYDDEYIMTPAACLLGLGEYLAASSDAEWLGRRQEDVAREIARMRGRDVDGDGLVESTHRLGRSGSHQWSTNWFDVVSYGWKDAFTNALLYRALRILAETLPRLGRPRLADSLPAWAERLRGSYSPAFFNPETGWYAGWRCADGKLHDYAFPSVNGAAVTAGLVDGARARDAISRLWAELARGGFDDFRLGLPYNLKRIPDEDMGTWHTGKPMGWYANGGVSLSQARHFIGAMYAVGMAAEADRALTAMCESLADGTAFGGCASGIDLRTWDGTACGYEGILCDQLGILAVAIDRFSIAGGRST